MHILCIMPLIAASTILTAQKAIPAGSLKTVLGQALKGRRQSIYLVSKTGINANTRAPAMMRNLEASLGRLYNRLC